MPMSWPKSTTSGSSSRARASARLTAWMRVSSAMALSHRLRALGRVGSGKIRMKMIENRFWPFAGRVEMPLDGGLDLLGDLLRRCLLLRLAPHAVALHEG